MVWRREEKKEEVKWKKVGSYRVNRCKGGFQLGEEVADLSRSTLLAMGLHRSFPRYILVIRVLTADALISNRLQLL